MTVNGDSSGKKFHVPIYAIVRIKVSDVQARNQQEAIKMAESSLDLHALLGAGENQEFAEDIDCYCVDEAGDEGYLKTQWYQKDGVTRMDKDILS